MALKPFTMLTPQLIESSLNHEVYKQDSNKLIRKIKGDILYIEDNKGEIISFVVRDFQSFDPKADASDVFGSPDGKSHLNLITCGGAWDKTQKSYSKRLVVFTDKE